MGAERGDQRLLRGTAVVGDVRHHRRVGGLGDLVMILHGGVEQFAEHCRTEPEQQTQDRGEADVAQRLRGDRRARQCGGVHDRCLDRCPTLTRRRLQLGHEAGELLGDGLCETLRLLGTRVGDGELQQHGLEYDGRLDLVRELIRLDVETELVNHPAGQLAAVDEVGVRRNSPS